MRNGKSAFAAFSVTITFCPSIVMSVRSRALASVMVQRGNYVVRRDRFAGMERHTLTDLEDPRRAIRRFPAFGDFRDQGTVCADLDQIVVTGGRKGLDVKLVPEARIIAIRGRAMANSGTEYSALFWLGLGHRHASRQDQSHRRQGHPTFQHAATGHSVRKHRICHRFPPL
jgi:hypothetical protein